MNCNESKLYLFLAALRLLVETYESEQQDTIPIKKIKSLLHQYNLAGIAMSPPK